MHKQQRKAITKSKGIEAEAQVEAKARAIVEAEAKAEAEAVDRTPPKKGMNTILIPLVVNELLELYKRKSY